jgi:hypothetical protein
MPTDTGRVLWWASAAIRISHPDLDPARMSQILNSIPTIALRPGESKVSHGACKSAGYWCTESRIEEPDRPHVVFLWAEDFVMSRRTIIQELIREGYDIDVYIGIHSSILALGFEVPATPTLWQLGIVVGVEYFSS